MIGSGVALFGLEVVQVAPQRVHGQRRRLRRLHLMCKVMALEVEDALKLVSDVWL